MCERVVRVEQVGARRLGRKRRKGHRPDETRRRLGHHRDDGRAGVDELAADLDDLVSGDAAGDAEDDDAALQGGEISLLRAVVAHRRADRTAV